MYAKSFERYTSNIKAKVGTELNKMTTVILQWWKKEWQILLKGIRWYKQFQWDTKKTPPTKKKFRFPFAAGLFGGTKSKTDENRCELGAYQNCLVYYFFSIKQWPFGNDMCGFTWFCAVISVGIALSTRGK